MYIVYRIIRKCKGWTVSIILTNLLFNFFYFQCYSFVSFDWLSRTEILEWISLKCCVKSCKQSVQQYKAFLQINNEKSVILVILEIKGFTSNYVYNPFNNYIYNPFNNYVYNPFTNYVYNPFNNYVYNPFNNYLKL